MPADGVNNCPAVWLVRVDPVIGVVDGGLQFEIGVIERHECAACPCCQYLIDGYAVYGVAPEVLRREGQGNVGTENSLSAVRTAIRD